MVACEASAMVSSITSSFGTIAGDCLDAISGVLPIALPVMGAMVVVGIGITIFKKTTKAGH